MMQEETRTKAQLLGEIGRLQERVSELEQANQTLRHSEQTWRSLAENAPNFIIITDSNGKIEFINRTKPGFTTDRTLGRTIYDFLERAYHQTAKNALTRVFQIGKPTKYEAQVTVPGDKTYWVETHVGPIKHDGKVTAAVLLSTDITPRKKAAEALRQSQETTHAFFDAIPDTAVLMDKKANILAINRAGAQKLGTSVDEIVGKNSQDIFPADVFELRRSKAAQVIRTGKMVRYEDQRAGLHFDTCICPVFDAQGTVERLAVFARDITERKKAEAALRSQQELLSNIVSNIPHSIFWKDRNSVYLGCNDDFAKAAGVENPADIIGKTDYDLPWRKEEADFYRKIDRQVMAKGSPIINLEESVHDAGGRSATILTSKVPLRNVAGEIIAILGIYTDITERKKAEQTLKIRDRAIASSINAIAFADPQGNLTYVNDSFLKMWGYDEEDQVLAKHSTEFWQQKDEAADVMQELHKTGSWIGELTAVRQDNSTSDIQVSASAVRDEKRNVICMMGSFVDVTERNRAEEELYKAQAQYRALVEQIPAITYVAMLDDASTTTYISPQVERMLGISPRDYREDPDLWRKHIHPQDRQRVLSRVVECHDTGKPFTCEYRMIAKDGRTICISDHARIVHDSGGNPVCLQGIMLDVTDRKRQEQALRESEENFRAIFDNATDGILVADPKTTKYITGNRMICRMLGYTLEELKNLQVKDIHPEGSLKDDLRRFEKVLNRQIRLSEDVPVKRKDGSIFHADINTAFLRFGGKECLMGIFRDITAHKQAELRLERYREEVAQAERLASLGTLSATLAHELTQPLTVVRLSIENSLADLEKASRPASATDQLKDSLAEISHTVSIIDRLRNFARKSFKEDVTEVDLETIADRIVMLLDASARRARITLCLKDLDKLPHIFANEKDLEQLFFALIENAIHAADDKKNRRLTVSAAVQGRHIELRFSDNCTGIAPKNLDKIFEPFFTTKSAGEGTGLGLCIVQRIVSHAGGKIRVESKTGKGTTFFITLPINKAGRS